VLQPDGLAVVGVFFEFAEEANNDGSNNNKFTKFLANVREPAQSHLITDPNGIFTVRQLIKSEVKEYYSYKGDDDDDDSVIDGGHLLEIILLINGISLNRFAHDATVFRGGYLVGLLVICSLARSCFTDGAMDHLEANGEDLSVGAGGARATHAREQRASDEELSTPAADKWPQRLHVQLCGKLWT
jgi:hypothetical protein